MIYAKANYKIIYTEKKKWYRFQYEENSSSDRTWNGTIGSLWICQCSGLEINRQMLQVVSIDKKP